MSQSQASEAERVFHCLCALLPWSGIYDSWWTAWLMDYALRQKRYKLVAITCSCIASSSSWHHTGCNERARSTMLPWVLCFSRSHAVGRPCNLPKTSTSQNIPSFNLCNLLVCCCRDLVCMTDDERMVVTMSWRVQLSEAKIACTQKLLLYGCVRCCCNLLCATADMSLRMDDCLFYQITWEAPTPYIRKH